MYEVCILTATRAEYGLLRPLFFRLQKDKDIHVSAIVTGMHLSDSFGMTYRQIEKDGIDIAAKIPILLDGDTSACVSKAMGLAMIGFSDFFSENQVDCLIVLGDRFETLAVACAAFNEHIPIAHLHGGERTEGALDDAYRHAITKLSYLHFTSTEEYRRRVIQLGEAPERVFCVGALGVENALCLQLMEKKVLEKEISFSLEEPFAVVTFHPATVDGNAALIQCRALLDAMDAFDPIRFLCTKANADSGGRLINKMLEEYAAKHDRVLLVDSLGPLKYLSAVRYSRFVLGNSSSGLLEAPSLGVPTVNIGDRQKGRVRGESVIDCNSDTDSIITAMKKAISPEMRYIATHAKNPYQGECPSREISAQIAAFVRNRTHVNKVFYDIK